MARWYVRAWAPELGSCCKVLNRHTGQAVVIEASSRDALKVPAREATILIKLQVAAVQRLVGVCVKIRQLASHVAGMTAKKYLKNTRLLLSAHSVFL